jgi:NADH pyrophosphatase NudC (nudix superfamily)
MVHPLEKFRFCPVCGSKAFEVNNFKSKKCHDCGFTYYANPCSATAAFIVDDAYNLLVVRRAKEPAKGTLDLPGGFCDMGETVEEGMRREITEETGLQVDEIRYLFSSPNVYQYSGMGVHTLDMDFLVRVSGTRPSVRAADDAAEALWLPVSEVNPADFGLTSIRNAVIRFLSETLRNQKNRYIYKV